MGPMGGFYDPRVGLAEIYSGFVPDGYNKRCLTEG